METDEIVRCLAMGCWPPCILLSLWNLKQRFLYTTLDRLLPAMLQVGLVIISLIPSFHGHPRELLIPTLLTFVWSGFAIGCSYRLYRLPVRTVRALAVLQFIQSAMIAFLALLDYNYACDFYYGRWVWTPSWP